MRNQSWWGRLKRRVRYLFQEHPTLWGVAVLVFVMALVETVALVLWLGG